MVSLSLVMEIVLERKKNDRRDRVRGKDRERVCFLGGEGLHQASVISD